MFGAFGYELDLNRISDDEFDIVKEQIKFMKEHRKLTQFGTFYRLRSPYDSNQAAWMVVSEDKKEAIVAVYTMRSEVNKIPGLLKLQGLDKDFQYEANGRTYYGDELMNVGIPLRKESIQGYSTGNDGSSGILLLKQC